MKAICLLFIAMPLYFAAFGQTKNITMFGKIMDQNMKPIPNVMIMLKGSALETKTDSLGKYKFMLPPRAGILIYTHPNFNTREEKFTGTPQATDLILVRKKVN